MLSQACLSLALLLNVVAADEEAVIRWKFKEGDVFYMKSDVSMRQTITVMGRKVEQSNDQSTVTRFTVKKKNRDGGVVLEQTILEVKAKGNLAGSEEIQKKMKGVTFKTTLDANGKLTSFEGYENLLDKLSGGNDTLRATVASILPEDIFKQALAEAFSFAPRNKVSVGETWKRSYKIPMGPIGDFAGQSTYKYAGKAKADGTEVDRLTFTATLKYSPPAKQVKGLPFQVSKGNLKAEDFKGTLLFDSAAGRLVESTAETHVTGGLTFSIMGNMADVELDQRIRMKSQLLPKAPSLE